MKVVRLVRKTEFRLLDESVTAEEIKEVVAARRKVQLSDIRIGPLRLDRGGLNTAWLQCPVLNCCRGIMVCVLDGRK